MLRPINTQSGNGKLPKEVLRGPPAVDALDNSPFGEKSASCTFSRRFSKIIFRPQEARQRHSKW